MLSTVCVGKAFCFWCMTQNRQAHEIEHQLSIALVDSDGWKQIAVYDTVCPKFSVTVK